MSHEPPFGRFTNARTEMIVEWLDKMENWFPRCNITESTIKAVYVRDYLDNSLLVDVHEFKNCHTSN